MNKEQLTETILEIKTDTDVKDKTNAELDVILATLQSGDDAPPPAPQGHPDGAAADAAEAKADVQAAREAETSKPKPKYQVASGMSLSSKRGIIDEGCAVNATDFVGGETDFSRLLKDGCIVRN